MIQTTQDPKTTSRQFIQREFNIGISLMKRNQFLDASDRFISVLTQNAAMLPDILIPLYKQLNAHSQNLHLRILISKLYMFGNRYKDAVQELEECIEIDPKFTQSYFLLSKIYSKGVEKPLIQALFETAFENGIFDSAILDLLPNIYLESQKTEKSIALYKKLIEINPNSIHYYKMLGELYSKNNDVTLAAKTYKTASELSPKSTPEFAKLCECLIEKAPINKEVRHVLIDLHLKSFNPIRATEHIEALQKMDPSETEPGIKLLKRCLNLYPNTDVALVGLSQSLAAVQEFSESIDYLNQYKALPKSDTAIIQACLKDILTKYPTQVLALNFMIKETLEQNDYETALDYCRQLIYSDVTEHPKIVQVLKTIQEKVPSTFYETELYLAQFYAKTRQHAACETVCTSLFESKYDLESREILFASTTQAHGLRLSQKILHEALPHHPFSNSLHEKIETTYYQILTQALESKTIELTEKHTPKSLKSTSSESQKSIEHPQSKIMFEKGLILLRKGDIIPAIETFQEITAPKPLQTNATILTSRCFLELGRFDLGQKHLESLLSKLGSAQVETTNKIRYLLSINLIHFGKISEAVQLLEQIVVTDIKFPNIQSILTTYKKRRFKDMRGLALSGVFHQNQLHPSVVPNTEKLKNAKEAQTISFAHPHNNQGVHYLITRSLQAAQDEFNLALQMDPQFTVSYCNLALVHIEQNDVLKAKKCLDTAREINPEFELIDHHLGLLELKCNQPEKAIPHFQNCLKKNPDNFYAMLNLSDLYRKLGNLKKSYEHLLNANQHHHLSYLIHRRALYLTLGSLSIQDWICSKNSDFFDLISPLLTDETCD